MKICMVVHKDYYHDPRVKRYTHSLLNLGVSVDVICPIGTEIVHQENPDLLSVYAIPIKHRQGSNFYYFFEYSLAFIFYFFEITLLYIKNHYEVIHVNNVPDFLVFTALIPKLIGAKIILDIHDPMPELYLSKFSGHANKFVLQIIELQEKISCKIANSIITANLNFKTNLKKRGIPGDKIKVVNNVPDSLLFNRHAYINERQSVKDSFTMIYHGTLAPRYGLEIPIKALMELIPKIPEINFIIIGPNSLYKESLIQLANRLDVAAHIQFRTLVPVEEIPSILTKADIGIYPAISSPHMDIATPTKVLEYAFMGIPIISSRLKILEDLFGNFALKFFEPGDIKQFSKCVIELFENPSLREELVRNADREFVQKCSWKNEFNIYINTINYLFPNTLIIGTKKDIGKSE